MERRIVWYVQTLDQYPRNVYMETIDFFWLSVDQKLGEIISLHVHHLKGNYLNFLEQINLRLWELLFVSYSEFSPRWTTCL